MGAYYERKIKEPIIPIGPSIAYIPLSRGQFALVDVDSLAIVGGKNWCARPDKNGYYAFRKLTRNGPTVSMHRVLLGLEVGDPRMGDHKNPARTLDNRIANLRIATDSQNNANRRTRTQAKGVTIHCDRYTSAITKDGKTTRLGSWPLTPEGRAMAAKAYQNAALVIHGEFAQFGGIE